MFFSSASIYDFKSKLKVDEPILTGLFCQNASVWNKFQLYIVDKGKLWVTNMTECDISTKKLDADPNQRKKQIFLTNKKSNH